MRTTIARRRPSATRMLVSLALVVTAQAATAQERSYTRVERELDALMAIWPGDYDNREQLQTDSDQGRKSLETGAHLRVHSQVRRVDLPAIGPHVLYVEEYRDNDPQRIFRQRIYVLSADEKTQAIRLELGFFNDGKRLLGAHKDPAKLAGLTRAGISILAGCELLIRRDSDVFEGRMAPKACVFGETGRKRYADYQLRVRPGQFEFRDRTLDAATDAVLEQAADFGWNLLRKARPFVCMIDVPRQPGGPPVVTQHYADLHDQGGTFAFKHPDGRDMVLTLRNFWSYEMRRDTFVVAVQLGNEQGPTLVYGWGAPGSDRIGVNPGYLRVQCDLDTAENRELQQRLRPTS